MRNRIEKLYEYFINSSGISTDTRKITKGNIFFALKGPNFDANSFAESAIKEGAKLVVIDNPLYKKESEDFFLVEDVLKTFQELANYHRKKLKIPILAITGSNGKTTTKELAYQVLSQKFKTYATKGNLNNHIGVPISLLEITSDYEVAVIEMGANKPGDIHELCEIAEPNYGLITNIGKAHLEGFGSVEGIKKTKGELYQFVNKTGGKILVNQNEKELIEMSQSISEKEFYGVESELIEVNPYIVFEENQTKKRIKTHLIGTYNYQNICSSLAIASLFEVEIEKALEAISEYIPNNNRSQIIKKGSVTIILDAYNANPTSMEVALESFSMLRSENKLLILGEMLELGNESHSEHEKLLKRIIQSGFNKVILVGKEFDKFKKEYAKFQFLDNNQSLITYFQTQNIEGVDSILIKGSRKNKLETIVEYID